MIAWVEFLRWTHVIGASVLLGTGAGISNYDEYRHQTGIYKGMEAAVDLAYQLMKQRDLADEGGDLPPMPPGQKRPANRRGSKK